MNRRRFFRFLAAAPVVLVAAPALAAIVPAAKTGMTLGALRVSAQMDSSAFAIGMRTLRITDPFRGALGGSFEDISAGRFGLLSETLDFTALGLAAGQWIKIGGRDRRDHISRFAAEQNNCWAQIFSIAPHHLWLRDRPNNWCEDNGVGRAIQFWVGERIPNIKEYEL